MLDQLAELREQIENDLRVATAIEDNEYHLQGLNAVESLIDYLQGTYAE